MGHPSDRSKGTIVLDHIVILVPYSFLALTGVHQAQSSRRPAPPPPLQDQETQKRPLQDLFTFSPGGRHSDGLTENVLVLLPDGVYLELIAFTPTTSPEDRRRHKWGSCEEGNVVDWAATVYHPDDSDEGDDGSEIAGKARRDYDAVIQPIADAILEKHSHDGGAGGDGVRRPIIPGPFVPGGRKRPDGVELKWAVVPAVRSSSRSASGDGDGDSSPLSDVIRPGQAPFLCLDETPRRFRVPYKHTDPSFIEHPVTGAVGVARVQVKPVAGDRQTIGRFYDAMFGDEGTVWQISTPEGSKLHPDGEVHLWYEEKEEEEEKRADDEGAVVISFYTDKAELAGTKVEGEIEGYKGIVFELVGI